jgi:hypothetical protein
LWAALKDERGIAGRDAIWQHPDLLPTAQDLDDPAGFTERRRLAEASDTEVDDALQKLLEGGYDAPKDEGNTEGNEEAPKPENGDSPDNTEPGEPKA